MNFLDKLVIPLSPEHIALLHYIAMLIFFLFIPYSSMVLGGTLLSLIYKRKGLNESNHLYINFAKDVIETVTINTSMGIVLGILTLVTSIFIFVQLFHTASLSTVSFLIASIFLVTFGLILIYTYRYSFSFSRLFDSMKSIHTNDDSVAEELSRYREKSISISSSSGRFGVIFLFIGLWLFISGVTIAGFPDKWNSGGILSTMFSWDVIFRFITFLLGSSAFTGVVILFKFFYWDGGKSNLEESYKEFVKKIALFITATGALPLPVFLWINVVLLPNNALSYSVFTYTIIALLLLFLAYHYIYIMFKTSSVKQSSFLFFTILLTIMAIIVKDQLAMGNATQKQTEILRADFTQVMEKLTGESNAPKVSGEAIYKNICSACHSFDHKVVGPPYEQTLPKYKGNVDKLVTFILNPKQNNPGYPPMPNPGLNPVQARAVATYILKEVKKYE
jgi:cytochrome c